MAKLNVSQRHISHLIVPLLALVAENETIGEPVAFKVLNKHKIRKLCMQEKVKREVKAMKKLQHPHIVCLYQVIDTQSDIFLALELATGGDMYDRICSQGKVSFYNKVVISLFCRPSTSSSVACILFLSLMW